MCQQGHILCFSSDPPAQKQHPQKNLSKCLCVSKTYRTFAADFRQNWRTAALLTPISTISGPIRLSVRTQDFHS